MKTKHKLKRGLALLLAGGLALTNLGTALPAFAEESPATPETAASDSAETEETAESAPDLAQIADTLYNDLPDAPTGSYLGSMGLPVATGETKISISAWTTDLYDGEDAHLDADALQGDEATAVVGKADSTDYAVIPLLVQTEYPENGATSEIILPDDVELLSYTATDSTLIPADESEQGSILHQTYTEQSAAATGFYVKATSDFTAQFVYTAPDGSSLTKSVRVQIQENAVPTQLYADADAGIATYASAPNPPFTTGKITSIAKEAAPGWCGSTELRRTVAAMA